jgi:hypothetical protein
MTKIFKAGLTADQTGISNATYTKVALDTASVDEGSHFASGGWTPPAGAVIITGRIYIKSGVTGTNYQIRILKNGTPIKQNEAKDGSGLETTAHDRANGTDVYELEFYGETTSTLVIGSNANKTVFSGIALEA